MLHYMKKLCRILAEAYSENIPKASLQGALKNFMKSDTQEVGYISSFSSADSMSIGMFGINTFTLLKLDF